MENQKEPCKSSISCALAAGNNFLVIQQESPLAIESMQSTSVSLFNFKSFLWASSTYHHHYLNWNYRRWRY